MSFKINNQSSVPPPAIAGSGRRVPAAAHGSLVRPKNIDRLSQERESSSTLTSLFSSVLPASANAPASGSSASFSETMKNSGGIQSMSDARKLIRRESRIVSQTDYQGIPDRASSSARRLSPLRASAGSPPGRVSASSSLIKPVVDGPSTHQTNGLPQTSTGDDEGTATGSAEDVVSDPCCNFMQDIVTIRNLILSQPVLAVLLLFIPLGFAAYFFHFSNSYLFIFNFLAIIPLAWLLGEATEELALRTNETLGGLLNATFGNAVELIVSVVALRKGYIKLVQTSLLGSILSNLLLVLGMSFLLGGWRYSSQSYNQGGASIFSSLLLLACIATVIPATFVNSFTPAPPVQDLLSISRLTALIMFIIYILYLFFQLYTHTEMFEQPDEDDEEVNNGNTNESENEESKKDELDGVNALVDQVVIEGDESADEDHHATNHTNGYQVTVNDENDENINFDDDDDDTPSLSLMAALSLLVFVTLCVAACSEFLVDSIKEVTTAWHLNESFVGIILLPIVGNAAEHATAVTVAMKDKMDLAIGVAIGSSTQIALFLIPFITLLGWIIDQPMTLNFTEFETVVLVMSVLIVNFLVKSGESNWLQGVMLLAAYFIIATAFFFHPPTAIEGSEEMDRSAIPSINQ